MTIIDLEWVSSQIAPITFAVFINLLDAVTFGTCFFPIALGDTSSFAIDLFLFSTVVVQVVFLLMSNFQCAVGTSMAENIPFIHTMALSVYSAMGAGKGDYSVEQMFPTIMVTLCASTILNGEPHWTLCCWRYISYTNLLQGFYSSSWDTSSRDMCCTISRDTSSSVSPSGSACFCCRPPSR